MSAGRVLVTGGAGFIGSHLVDRLLGAGSAVTVIDNLRNGSLERLEDARAAAAARGTDALRFIRGDILDPAACEEAMRDAGVVFHLACLGVRHSLHSPLENHEVNATGTLRVLEAARQAGVKRFFYVSTSEVYGKVKSFPIRESDLPEPCTVYGSSKLAGEHYALSYLERHGMDVTVLRIFNNYGPRSHYEGDSGEILPRSIVLALRGEQPVIFGDGSVTRDFFYVKDTARALSALPAIPGLAGATINIGTGTEITMARLLELTLERMGQASLGVRRLDARPADVPRLWVDASRFRKLTGFQAQWTLEQGLDETIASFRALHARGALREIPILNWTR